MGKDGHTYIIGAADGSTLTLARWRLIPVGPELPHGMKMARSVNDAKTGMVKKILNYNEKDKKYHVLWRSATKARVTTHEPVSVIRALRDSPEKLTTHEEEYWKGKEMPDGILP
jgi:hypothetical protein